MPLSEKQRKIMAFPATKKYQALICDGAVRSGKTSIMTASFIDWAMREFNNTNFAICGKTVGSAIKNIITPYMALTYARERYRIHFNRSDNKMIVQRGFVQNVFYIYGGKDESSYMLIQGITLAGILLDEVALMTRSFVEQALARCMSYPNRRYWFNCNPESPMHWFYEEWILQPEKHRALHLHFLMSDNPAIDAEALREAENTWSGVFYDRYILGLWVRAEGIIYPQFTNTNIDNGGHIFTDAQAPLNGEWVASVDYGTSNPTAAGLWCISGNVAYMVREYYHDGRKDGQLTDEEHAANLVKLTSYRPSYQGAIPIYVDPSAASLIVTLRRQGFFAVRSANNDVLDGIRNVGSALKRRRLFINESCKNAIREMAAYTWDEKLDSNGNERPLKENDHHPDQIRYFQRSHMEKKYGGM